PRSHPRARRKTPMPRTPAPLRREYFPALRRDRSCASAPWRAPLPWFPLPQRSKCRCTFRHARRAHVAPQRRNAEDGIGRAISLVASPLHDFEKEALIVGGAVELEIFAALVAVIKHVRGLEPVGEFRIEAEPRFQIVV